MIALQKTLTHYRAEADAQLHLMHEEPSSAEKYPTEQFEHDDVPCQAISHRQLPSPDVVPSPSHSPWPLHAMPWWRPGHGQASVAREARPREARCAGSAASGGSLRGAHRLRRGVLLERHSDQARAVVQLGGDLEVVELSFDDVAEWVGGALGNQLDVGEL